MRLVRLSPDLEPAFRDMQSDYAAAGETRYDELAADFAGGLQELRDIEAGIVREGLVPWTSYWLLREDGVLLGGCRLRHRLSASLWQDGGHIGYDIRPSQRGRGYGRDILRLALDEARARGLSWVLLTVDPRNVASVRVIESNGGVPAGRAERSGYDRYRIELDQGGPHGDAGGVPH